MVVGPLYHIGPLGAVRSLAGGTAVVVMTRFDPEEVLKVIEHYKIKGTMMVPTHFQRLLELPLDVRERYNISSLRYVSHSGAACSVEVKRKMIDWFGPILEEAYGGSEAGTTNLIGSEEWLRKPGSVGLTQAPFELEVVSPSGELCGPTETGILYFRDTTGRGVIYLNDPDKTREAHREPAVFTLGDIGYVDPEGYVFITDRASDLVVSGGVNIYPAETEQILLTHPKVLDVAIIGVPNSMMGEELKALIVVDSDAEPPGTDELDKFCRQRLAGFKCPKSYDFVVDLGRSPLGKLNKRQLRRPFWPTERTVGG